MDFKKTTLTRASARQAMGDQLAAIDLNERRGLVWPKFQPDNPGQNHSPRRSNGNAGQDQSTPSATSNMGRGQEDDVPKAGLDNP
ncbi:unnamed protein product [Caenorhabditis nigoni]